jgi:hypothetical protein
MSSITEVKSKIKNKDNFERKSNFNTLETHNTEIHTGNENINKNKNKFSKLDDKNDVFKIEEDKSSKTFEESSFVGGMIKKIKEGVMSDSFKNEFITPVYEQVYLHVYPHYIIFFALLISIIVLQLLIFFAIFSLLNKK